MRLKQWETDHTLSHYYYRNVPKILLHGCFLISYTVSINRNGNLAQQNQCIYSDRYFNTTDSLKDVFLKDNILLAEPAVITNWLMP
jgi:hypothetical protein